MYLGLDLGTSGLRAILMEAGGAMIARTEQPYPLAHPAPGFSEQDPADWLAACGQALDDLRARAPRQWAALRGIGLSGQMHGAVLLDRADKVLRPAILWNDSRAAPQAATLDSMPEFRAISGNIVFPGFTAPKLIWSAEHEPDIFARISKVLLPKDYLRLWLTGEHVSDMSDASGTGWLDTCERAWSAPLLKATGMRRNQMPTLVEGSAPAGELRGDLAREWGLPKGVIVAGGGADNAAAACGAGCVEEGQGFVSLGTSGVILLARDTCSPAPDTAVHTFCHALSQRWIQMGVSLAATDSLNWLARQTGQSPEALSALAGPTLGPPPGPLFAPYLSGERTPHNDSRIRGAFVNLDIADTRADLARAVMLGVAFSLRDSLEALRQTGPIPARLIALGGGSRSPYWVAALATVLDVPVALPTAGAEGAALGAARLAVMARTGADASAVMTPPAIEKTVLPNSELRDAYAAAHARFRALYPALKSLP